MLLLLLLLLVVTVLLLWVCAADTACAPAVGPGAPQPDICGLQHTPVLHSGEPWGDDLQGVPFLCTSILCIMAFPALWSQCMAITQLVSDYVLMLKHHQVGWVACFCTTCGSELWRFLVEHSTGRTARQNN
jgi:hypothetical protein